MATFTGKTRIFTKQFEDWQSCIFHTGMMQNYEINLTGGSEKTQFATSFGYQKDKGLLLNDVYRRLNGKIGVDHRLNGVSAWD